MERLRSTLAKNYQRCSKRKMTTTQLPTEAGWITSKTSFDSDRELVQRSIAWCFKPRMYESHWLPSRGFSCPECAGFHQAGQLSKGAPSLRDHKPVRPVCPMADGVSSCSDQRFPAVQTDSREQAIDFEDAPESSIRKKTPCCRPKLRCKHTILHTSHIVSWCRHCARGHGKVLKMERNPLASEIGAEPTCE